MRGRATEPTRKVTIRLFETDYQLLRQYFPKVGYNHAIRSIVRKSIQMLERRTREENPQLFAHELADINLEQET